MDHRPRLRVDLGEVMLSKTEFLFSGSTERDEDFLASLLLSLNRFHTLFWCFFEQVTTRWVKEAPYAKKLFSDL